MVPGTGLPWADRDSPARDGPAMRLTAHWLGRLGLVIPVLLVVILGAAFSVYAFTTWRAFEAATAENNFKVAATARLANFRRRVSKPFDAMAHIETLIEAVGDVDEATFSRFASEVIRRNPEIEQLIWAPIHATSPGVPFNSPAQLSPAGFTASYLLPAGASEIIDRDIGTLPGYGECLNKNPQFNADSDRLCVHEVDGGLDIYTVMAVERLAPHGDAPLLSGAIGGRIHLKLSTTLADGSGIEIFDLNAPGGMKRLLAAQTFDGADSVSMAGSVFQDLLVGSEAWRVVNFPTVRTGVSPSKESLFVLAACLAVTVHIAAYISLILHRRRKTEVTVTDRTLQLETALSDLRLSEQRLQSYISTASDWYWETDKELRFTRVAAQAREHKIEPDELIGLDRLTADDADLEVSQRGELLGGHQMFRDLRYDYATDRELLTLSLSGLPIFASDGRFMGYRGSARDITLQLQVEAKQRQARWTAEQANRTKSNFLATMSHEIRTPMNGVLGMVQALSDTVLDPEQRRMCDVIYRSGHSLHQILNDILDYSKLEAGKITLESIASSLIDIVDSVVDLMRGTAEASGLTIEVETVDGPPPPVVIDPTRLRQVLFNLTSNAIKFSERGAVTIRLRGVPAEEPGELAVTLSIADQGIGISAEAQQRLFARFSQADGSTTRRYGGTGLGLAITKELVTLMGGTISVRSVPGQGTTFIVQLTLPIAEPIAEILTPPRFTEQSADARVLDILVAEDNDINQEVIQGLLRGHRLTIVGDGCQAVEAFQTGRFDLVLMDVMMPAMNGLEATGAIRALGPEGVAVPIIALTANSMSGDRERYLSAGMTDYVSKPIERENLFKVMELVTGHTVWRPISAGLSPARAPAAKQATEVKVDDFIASLGL